METKTHAPSFTVSLRGYDRMEVDDYLDSLSDALGRVQVAQQSTEQMQYEIVRLRARVAELEERIRTESPKTGAALGERISLILQEAEDAAAEMQSRAEAEADATVRTARAKAAELMAEAEAKAAARTRQIEQWAEQVISHTRGEEARMLAEMAGHRADAEAQIQALIDRRDIVAVTLANVQRSIDGALGAIGAEAAECDGPDAPPVMTGDGAAATAAVRTGEARTAGEAGEVSSERAGGSSPEPAVAGDAAPSKPVTPPSPTTSVPDVTGVVPAGADGEMSDSAGPDSGPTRSETPEAAVPERASFGWASLGEADDQEGDDGLDAHGWWSDGDDEPPMPSGLPSGARSEGTLGISAGSGAGRTDAGMGGDLGDEMDVDNDAPWPAAFDPFADDDDARVVVLDPSPTGRDAVDLRQPGLAGHEPSASAGRGARHFRPRF